jgi:hypothetical protein
VTDATTTSERRSIEDLLGFAIRRADRSDPGTTTTPAFGFRDRSK